MKKGLSILLMMACMAALLCDGYYVPAMENPVSPSASADGEQAERSVDTSDVYAAIRHNAGETATAEITLDAAGAYRVGVVYTSVSSANGDFYLSIQIDGFPLSAATETSWLPKMWMDAGKGRMDANGNEYPAEQVAYDKPYLNFARSSSADDKAYCTVTLEAGRHTVALVPQSADFVIEGLLLRPDTPAPAYQAPSEGAYYTGEPIVLEGESATVKSSRFLVGKTDTSSADVTPHSYARNVVNYIGGGNWKNVGDTIVWETPEMEEGWYKLGLSFRQNTVLGGKTYRVLRVDGRIPFAEASSIGFSYGDNWQRTVFGADDGTPYLIWLSAGRHTISLEVTAGDIAPVQEKISEAVALMSRLYVDITMITGENVDIYRDYDLFAQIGDMEERLVRIRAVLAEASETLAQISGEKTGSNYSVLQNMIEVVDQMLGHRFEAHRYKSYYYSNYCSVSSVLQDLRNMPLDIDKIVLSAPQEEKPLKKASVTEKLQFSFMRFLTTFVRDYSNVSSGDAQDGITIWVNWGRDQAQVLSSLIDRQFTGKTGIPVNMKLVNANIIQATLSGEGPDCILQHSRSEPVNLAMRGVLYDLTAFSDLDRVLERFQTGADIPYRYKGGLYALPDTQTFYMMFYRKDILEELRIPVPETWENFKEASKICMRNNMSVWLPNNPATDNAQVNAGVGSNNIFPSMLLQNGLALYAEDGKRTTMLSAEFMTVFEQWTDYYTKLKFPVTMSFYTRFRTGTTPLGIAPYTFYTTVKVGAPEMDGLWSMAAIPGTVSEDGTVNHASSGGGTGCAILKNTAQPEKAWEFLKWWTDSETQLAFSNELESILGPAGRVALANVEAIQGLNWDGSMLDSILEAWDEVAEIPEYPGSYYVSRSIYQSFWNVVNDNQNTKDVLMDYGTEADDEIARKWKQYSDRDLK